MQLFDDAGQRRDLDLPNDVAIARFFAARQALDFGLVARPAMNLGDDLRAPSCRSRGENFLAQFRGPAQSRVAASCARANAPSR
jgi:hypothetical protein